MSVHRFVLIITSSLSKVSKVAKIRNRYNRVPHLTQDTNGKVTNSQKTKLLFNLNVHVHHKILALVCPVAKELNRFKPFSKIFY